jgi:hypothetical protein
MSIAAIVAVALAAASAPKAPVNRTTPPIVIDVAAITDVSPSLLATIIGETEALYRTAGVHFVWRHDSSPLATLHVLITKEAGPARPGNNTPLGWLDFEQGIPGRDIHVSYGNAVHFMEESREIVGTVSQKTIAERDALLGRALGRALAHELAHYLLATAQHSANGMLRGARTAQEFFSPDRRPFAINSLDRLQIIARLNKELDVASRD